MRKIGYFWGSAFKHAYNNKVRFVINSILLWFFVISNFTLYQDDIALAIMFILFVLIYGSFFFRVFLIGRGILRIAIGEKTSK